MTFSAVLLAGGESRRMGRDKATIDWEGTPLWQRQLELLRVLGSQQLFVAARTTPDWCPKNVELLLDDPPSRGPLSGLTKALTAMQTTHLIALAVDMPFMTGGELRELVSRATADAGVIPMMGQQAEPLAAIYPARAAADFGTALFGEDFSLQRIVRALAEAEKAKLYPVPIDRAHFYRSLNTPSDLML